MEVHELQLHLIHVEKKIENLQEDYDEEKKHREKLEKKKEKKLKIKNQVIKEITEIKSWLETPQNADYEEEENLAVDLYKIQKKKKILETQSKIEEMYIQDMEKEILQIKSKNFEIYKRIFEQDQSNAKKLEDEIKSFEEELSNLESRPLGEQYNIRYDELVRNIELKRHHLEKLKKHINENYYVIEQKNLKELETSADELKEKVEEYNQDIKDLDDQIFYTEYKIFLKNDEPINDRCVKEILKERDNQSYIISLNQKIRQFEDASNTVILTEEKIIKNSQEMKILENQLKLYKTERRNIKKAIQKGKNASTELTEKLQICDQDIQEMKKQQVKNRRKIDETVLELQYNIEKPSWSNKTEEILNSQDNISETKVQELEEKKEKLKVTVDMKILEKVKSTEKKLKDLLDTAEQLKKEEECLVKKLEECEQKIELKLKEGLLKINNDTAEILKVMMPNFEAQFEPIESSILHGLELKIKFKDDEFKDSIHNLSTEERSLLSLALTFAKEKKNPSAIYIIDDVNVITSDPEYTKRFEEMVKIHFNKSQFFVTSSNQAICTNKSKFEVKKENDESWVKRI